MNFVPLTKDIQLVILAVQAYKRFIRYDNEIKNPTSYQKFDWWDACEKYYKSLSLPNGMNTSDYCFESVIDYPIEKTRDIRCGDLPKTFSFPYSENKELLKSIGIVEN